MKTYEERVAELEAQGLTTSDAQGVVDAKDLKARRHARLIASAPDLLCALKLALVLHPHNVTFQQAIAKAEGKAEGRGVAMNLKLTITIHGNDAGDLALALEEVARLVNNGFTSGAEKNDTGSYSFTIGAQQEVRP